MSLLIDLMSTTYRGDSKSTTDETSGKIDSVIIKFVLPMPSEPPTEASIKCHSRLWIEQMGISTSFAGSRTIDPRRNVRDH